MASLLDPRFKYVPSHSTDVRQTWQRHGFKPSDRHTPKGAEWQTSRSVLAQMNKASNEEDAALAA